MEMEMEMATMATSDCLFWAALDESWPNRNSQTKDPKATAILSNEVSEIPRKYKKIYTEKISPATLG